MAIYQKKDKNGKVIKDTKGNSWYYRCYYTDMYGNRKQRESKLFPTKGMASEEERKFLEETKNKDIIDDGIPFSKVCLEWLDMKQDKVKITTYYGTEKAVNKHILPYFSNHKLFNIKVNTLSSWKSELIKKGMSVRRTNLIISYLKDILNYANEYYDFDKKVVKTLTEIRDDTPKSDDSIKGNYWTYEEFGQFIECVDNEYDKLIFTFLYRTGLRIGEMMALTWKDIDLTAKKVSITKSITNKTLTQGKIITTPKTKNSVRIIDLDNTLIALMIEYRKEQTSYIGFNDGWFIFGGVKSLGLTSLRRHLNKYIEISKVKKITIHGFRHSHVSLLINIGCDFKDVAERLGDTVKMVENTYYHMFPEKKNIIIERLNNI